MRSYYSRCAGILSVKILSYYCFDEFGPRFHDFVHFDSLCLCRRVAFLLHKPQNFSYRLKIRTNKNPIVILKWEDCCDWSSVFLDESCGRTHPKESISFGFVMSHPRNLSTEPNRTSEEGRIAYHHSKENTRSNCYGSLARTSTVCSIDSHAIKSCASDNAARVSAFVAADYPCSFLQVSAFVAVSVRYWILHWPMPL